LTRSQYGPAAGAKGGATVLPMPRQYAPEFLTFTHAELEALWNKAGNGLAERLYPRLAGRAAFKGPRKGWVESATGHPLTYAHLQAVLRPPKPEKGQWPLGPSLKQIRTALDALEAAGLIVRDRNRNQAQGLLQLFLPHRADGSAAERAQLRREVNGRAKPKPASAVQRDAREHLKLAAEALRVPARLNGQRAG
jgi:hypothetical protein